MIHIWCWFRTDHRTWSSPLPPPCSPGRGSACVVWGSSSAGTAWRRCHKWKPCHPPRAWTGGSSAGTSRGKSPRKCCNFITENQHKISIDFGGLRDCTFFACPYLQEYFLVCLIFMWLSLAESPKRSSSHSGISHFWPIPAWYSTKCWKKHLLWVTNSTTNSIFLLLFG